jgi:hypothetical protein
MAITKSEQEFLFTWLLMGAFFSLIIDKLVAAISPENALEIGIGGVILVAYIFKIR